MVPKANIFSVIFFFLFSVFSFVEAETSFGFSTERSGGEYIFETGNKYPNLSGIRGGSRISFTRDFTLFGFHGAIFKNKWEVRGSFKTTGWNQNAGKARDEDFALGTVSTERGTKIDTKNWAYNDSATVFTGSRNFADGIGKATINEHRTEFYGRYYFGESMANPWLQGSGFFLSGGARYSYFKYVFYDVNQFVDSNPVFYAPIGLGLTFSNDLWEFFYGGGYRYGGEKFYVDFNFMPSIGSIKTRDFHVQRSINFLSDNFGVGWMSQLDFGYKLSDNWMINLKLNHRRFFSEGRFKSQGGLTPDDIASNFASGFKSYINIKDYSVEIAASKLFNFDLMNKKDE